MQVLLFTKFFAGASVQEVGEAAASLGVDGLDLAVRARQCITPESLTSELPSALKIWEKLGLCVPMLTLEGNFCDPVQPLVRTLFETCAECKIPFIKLGYWKWQPGQNYQQGVEQIRRALEKFQELGREHSVCSLLHTHSGLFYGSNVASMMQLLEGFDPRFVGAYLDPAHQALQGGPPPLALGMAANHLKMIGVKNACYVDSPDGTTTIWKPQWCRLAQGLVDWREVIALLREQGYDGPLSLHTEYPASRDEAGVAAHEDLQYLRGLLAEGVG